MAQKLFEVINHLVTSVKMNMSEHNLIVELSFTNMFFEECPPVECDAHISSGFDHVNLIGISLELEQHSHVIKVRARIASRDVANGLITSEKQDVARIGLLNKLFLAHIIKSPWFLKSLGAFLILVALTLLNFCYQRFLPFGTCLLVLRLELKFSVKTFNLYLEL